MCDLLLAESIKILVGHTGCFNSLTPVHGHEVVSFDGVADISSMAIRAKRTSCCSATTH